MSPILVAISFFGVGMIASHLVIRNLWKGRYWRRALIADTMPPLVNKYITNESRIDIVGSDLFYLMSRPNLETRIREWLTKGCCIRYLISKPHDGGIEIIVNLQKDFPDHFQAKEILADQSSPNVNIDILNIINALKTFHFVVFSNPSQIWIEDFHPANTAEAYDCEYVPPKLANIDSRYGEYLSTFDKIWRSYSRVVEES